MRLERGGYECIGIIMVEDGYFRFFNNEMPYTVTVIGNDVEDLGNNSYRLNLDFESEWQNHE